MVESQIQLGNIIVLAGPSGVGKSTIAKRLRERTELKFVTSATTRPARPGDGQGKLYDHISIDAFLKRLDADQFLEYAEVYGHYYGTPKQPVLDALKNGQDVLLEIDVQGAFQVRFQHPGALLIYIMPPDDQTLLQRLRSRGSDSEEDIERRYRLAKRDIWMARGSRAFDLIIFNDSVDRAVDEMIRAIKLKRSGGL
jgi:guanylate kinase